MSSPVPVSAAEFPAFVTSAEVVVVDFWAPWCGPCKAMDPVLDELAGDGVTVGKVNVDNDPDLAQAHQVLSVPTLVVFRDGAAVASLPGARPKSAIVAALTS